MAKRSARGMARSKMRKEKARGNAFLVKSVKKEKNGARESGTRGAKKERIKVGRALLIWLKGNSPWGKGGEGKKNVLQKRMVSKCCTRLINASPVGRWSGPRELREHREREARARGKISRLFDLAGRGGSKKKLGQ